MRCVWRTCAPPEPQWPYDSQIYIVRISLDGLPPWTAAIEWRRVHGEGCRWGIGAENQHWVTHWLDGVEMPSEANTDVATDRESGEWQMLVIPDGYPPAEPALLEVESRSTSGESYFSRRWWLCRDGMWGFAEDTRAGVAMRWRPIT